MGGPCPNCSAWKREGGYLRNTASERSPIICFSSDVSINFPFKTQRFPFVLPHPPVAASFWRVSRRSSNVLLPVSLSRVHRLTADWLAFWLPSPRSPRASSLESASPGLELTSEAVRDSLTTTCFRRLGKIPLVAFSSTLALKLCQTVRR